MPRPPKTLARVVNAETGLSMMQAEILAETSHSLGHQGRKVEAALARLRTTPEHQRGEALREASRAVWAYFVQRELCGMRDHRLIIREMGIPDTVLRRLGS